MSYTYLIDIAVILLSTKLLGLVTKKFQMPQVVGALLAGLILGPACLNFLHQTEFLSMVAELGVIVIMFSAGLGTEIKELKQTGKSGFLVALMGVIIPLIGGSLLSLCFNGSGKLLENLFIGVILTATSVSITVETLREIGKLSTKVGSTILAAALIDDVLGLIALTVVTSLAGEDVNIALVLLKIVLFFVFIIVVGFLANRVLCWYDKKIGGKNLHRFPLAAFVLCLVMAYCAEEFFGVADIIGAFAAGVIVASTPKGAYVATKINPLSYLLLSPIFFASIGIKVTIPQMSWGVVLFAVLLFVTAVVTKLIGCGMGAKMCGFTWKQCMQVGFGMACRGEVALIVANKGVAMGVLPSDFFGPVIIMVVGCAILTPILLKLAFKTKQPEGYEDLHQSDLVDSYEISEQLDTVASNLLEKERQYKK